MKDPIEEEGVPTNVAGGGEAVAGLDDNPPGRLAADKKKGKKKKYPTFSVWARGQQ